MCYTILYPGNYSGDATESAAPESTVMPILLHPASSFEVAFILPISPGIVKNNIRFHVHPEISAFEGDPCHGGR